MANSNKVVLGSGKLYVTSVPVDGQIPADTVVETAENLLGLIQGGATLTYTPTFYEAKDDLGLVSKKWLTEEVVTLVSGIMTWNGETLKTLCATGRVTEDTENKTRTLKIGGIDQYNGTQYLIRFVHEDNIDGDIRITIIGSNEAGFEMAFAKDAETVINAEFKAQPMDNEGTLVIFTEEDKTITA